MPAASERERLLLATAELWRERGYEGLSVDAICAHAEIESEVFVTNFADVDAAAQAALEAPLAAAVVLVASQYGPDRSEPESCAMGIVAILELMAANPAYAYVLYVGRRQVVSARVMSSSRAGQRLLVAMLERLRESGGVSQQPATAGVGALGAAEVVIRREILAGRAEHLPSLAPDFVYGATVPFVGQREALRLAQMSRELSAGTSDG